MNSPNRFDRLALMVKGFLAGIAVISLALFVLHIRASSAQQSGQAPQAPGAVQVQVQTGAVPAPAQGRGRGGGFHEPEPLNFDDHAGYTQIFDGKSLDGWDGDPSVWHVEDGAIVGISTPEHPSHSFIAYKNLVAKDLDLKFEIKVEQGGGSGVQYRSKTGVWIARPQNNPRNPTPTNPNWLMTGPQADFWFPVRPQSEQYTGQFYTEDSPLGIIAWRGETVEMGPDSPPHLVATIQDRRALGGYVKTNDWNQYEVIARGGTFLHMINGQLMSVLVDDDASDANNHAGLIGIEIEGAPCKVSVRDVWVKKFN